MLNKNKLRRRDFAMEQNFKSLIIPNFTSSEIWNGNQHYRLKNNHHGNYDMVDISSLSLESNNNWPRVIDEALRACKQGLQSRLVLSSSDSELARRDEIMERIFLFCEGRVELISIIETPSKVKTIDIAIQTRITSSSITDISIGVITNGKNDRNLGRFLKSATTLKNYQDFDIEIIVAGPSDYVIPGDLINCIDRYLSINETDNSLPMITIKKNLIAEFAKYSNIIISHDRYVLDTNLLDTLLDFGGDFEVCAISATDGEGSEFPQWTSFNNNWKNGIELSPYDFNLNNFLNGGIFIVKKRTLDEYPLNPLLYWGFGEDIEWSRRLIHSGVTPKYIQGKGLTTFGQRDGYLSWFLPIPNGLNQEYIPAKDPGRENEIGFFPFEKFIKISDYLSPDDAIRSGLLLTTNLDLSVIPAAFIPMNKSLEFSLYVEFLPELGMDVQIDLVNSETATRVTKILCNEEVISVDQIKIEDGVLNFRIQNSRDARAGNSVIRFKIFLDSNLILPINGLRIRLGKEVNLKKVTVLESFNLGNYLTSGWHPSTEFGTWTNGKYAELAIPVTGVGVMDITLFGVVFLNSINRQSLKIWNLGKLVLDLRISSHADSVISKTLQNLLCDDKGVLRLSFEVGDPIRPSDVVETMDRRTLGFEIQKLVFLQ